MMLPGLLFCFLVKVAAPTINISGPYRARRREREVSNLYVEMLSLNIIYDKVNYS